MHFSVFFIYFGLVNAILDNLTSSFHSAAYFVNWAVYARNYTPKDLPSDKLTHVFYAFAGVHSNGSVFLTDTYSDVEKHFPGDSWNETDNNVYGCVNQLFTLKKKNRNLKVLLSVGGWTLSSNFSTVASSASARLRFANSAVTLIEDLGFDGIDIDWEYPSNHKEGCDLVQLVKECRIQLDFAASKRSSSTRFYLSLAASAGSTNYQYLQVQQIDSLLDFWNLMAYDFVGPLSSLSGYTANLYPSTSCPTCTPFNILQSMNYYIGNGATRSKILLGVPLYGRAFQQTSPGQPFRGIGKGSWEEGIWDYKALPLPGSSVFEDMCAVASWTFNNVTKTMIAYDDENVVTVKAAFVRDNQLGGVTWWESSADRVQGNGSLVQTFVSQVKALDQSQNCLDYPFSRYDNIKGGRKS